WPYTCASQLPDYGGQPPLFSPFGLTVNSTSLNENQIERNYFGIVAMQKKVNDIDLQLAYYTRYSSVHFTPDPIGDLAFNGVASDVFRSSFVNGVQADMAWRPTDAHTFRVGMFVQGETTQGTNTSMAFLPPSPPNL